MMTSTDSRIICSSIADRERKYTANDTVYTLRGLRPDELDSWASFCAAVFSYKAHPPPALYFSRHYYNDTHRKHPCFIRVASCRQGGDEQLVASCRIFWRTISDGRGGHLVAAGIGEVCTHQDHQRRGLCRQLLHDALDMIQELPEEELKVDISMLHAAPAFFPLYQSVGYQNRESQWKVVPVRYSFTLLDDSNGNKHVRLAQFPEDTTDLMKLYRAYSEERFAGCISRSNEYWENYISRELERRLWVYCDKNDECKSGTNLLGWISLRSRGENKYQLRDFGCSLSSSLSSSSTNIFLVFSRLLTKALDQLCSQEALSSSSLFQLLAPSAALQDVQESYQQLVSSTMTSNSEAENLPVLDFDHAVQENDGGWMYKPLNDSAFAWLERTGPDSPPHLIWPADSF